MNALTINSPTNERVKQARRVRERRVPGQLFVEGERLAEECLASGLRLSAGFYLPETSARIEAIARELERRRCPCFAVSRSVMDALGDTVTPQGIVLLAESPTFTLEQILTPRDAAPPLALGLASLQDPGNLGTILRTAEAAGVTGILATKGTADPYAPKTLRGAMGSAFRLPFAQSLESEAIFQHAREAGLIVAAADGAGEHVYSEYDLRQPLLLLLGNEAQGLSAEFLERADVRLRIPLCSPVESLNVAAAAAAILFEAARQRRNGIL